MADISIVINPAETILANISPPDTVSIGTAISYPPHAPSHAPGSYDSLSFYYVATGDLTGYVNQNQTGYLSGTFYPYSANPAGYVQGAVVRPSNTGNFVDKASAVLITGDQNVSGIKNFYSRPTVNGTGVLLVGEGAAASTGALTGVFYPLNANPSGYITGVDLSSYVTKSSTGIFVTTGQTGNFVTTSQTGQFVSTGSTGNFIVASQTGQFVSTGSTGNFVTGSVVRPSETGNFVVASQTGQFVSTGSTGNFVVAAQTGAFLTTGAADGRYALQSATGNFVTTGQTGNFVVATQTGAFLTTGAADGRYALQSATGNFVTTGQTGNFVVATQTGAFLTTGAADGRYALQSNTGVFITTGQTGQFYPISNPSGFITAATPIDTIQLYGKNDESFTLYKGQPVYIGGANGANPLIKRSSNTGESTSSKTIGLLAQNLNTNVSGYIISEGILEGFDTSAAAAGDPMWLGTTGDILFGTGNKPYGNNHLVYLGVVLRSNNNNGKVYVKPQNGFEIEELHRVYAKNATNKDTLMYDSVSGSWFARQISTGDVSGISNYVLAANTGSFVSTGQTGNFIVSSQTGQFVGTGSTGSFLTSSSTGSFLTTGAADNLYALQSATGSFATNSSVVLLTGNQNVSGVKNFFSRPTVAGTGVLLSGESVTTQPNNANLIIGLSIFI